MSLGEFTRFYDDTLKEQGIRLQLHHLPLVQMLLDSRIKRGLIAYPMASGVSTLLNIAYPAYRLGVSPNNTILNVVGGGKAVSDAFFKCLSIVMEGNPYQEWFPEVKDSLKRFGLAYRAFHMASDYLAKLDAPGRIRDVLEMQMSGATAQEIVCDSLHDVWPGDTDECQNKAKLLLTNSILTRGNKRGCRYIVSAPRCTENDLYAQQAATGEWVTLSLPAQRLGGGRLWVDAFVPNALECVFSEVGDCVGEHPNGLGLSYRVYYGGDDTGRGFYWPENKKQWESYCAAFKNAPSVARWHHNLATA